jgi:MoaA/NifB/PqqE/SkfB family radical SAM enzyme/GT2 family glycosyltransferase
MKQKLPLVSIVTVNYNGKQFLNDCFKSLLNLNYPKKKIEIFMVDNNSTDGSLEYVRKKFPPVKILINDENNYAKANNLGIKAAKGKYVALINNDVKVDKHWLTALVKAAENDASIGAVGSKILFLDGSIQSAGHYEYPDFYWGDIGFREKDRGQYNTEKEVIGICGCSVLYRRKCLEDVGIMDEDFIMYLEDVDMSIRCKKKGWKQIICPQSIIYHRLHGSIGSEDNARYWQETNRLLLIAKHWPEKLPSVLSGRDYFTVKNGYRNERDISMVLGKVFVKLIKEHGLEVTNRLSDDLFHTVRKIYNFEKSSLIYEIKEKDILVSLREQQLSTQKQQLEHEISLQKQRLEHEVSTREEELSLNKQQISSLTQNIESLKQQLSFLRQQIEHEIATRELKLSLQKKLLEHEISLREQQLSTQKQRLEHEVSTREEELSLNKQQISSLTQNIESLKQQRDQELSLLRHNQEVEINYYKLILQQVKSELNNIYSSTGYRYILKPLWDFLWPLKQKLKRIKLNIKSFFGNFSFELRDREKNTTGKTQKIFNKVSEIYYSLPIRGQWTRIYMNHIKYRTFPPKPERLTLMLNRICNLKCIFCDIPNANNRKDVLSKEKALQIIEDAKKIGIKEMILTGGEPFLHPDIFEIIDFANSRNINSVITTNGLFIKQHIDKIIKSGINCISVSIDGKEQTHDFLRNRQGAYKQAQEAIYLLKQNEINTSVNFVVTNNNVFELEDVYNSFSDLGIKVSFLPVINKPDLFPSKKEEKNTYLRFIKKLLQKNKISIYEYRYLKIAMLAYFSKKDIHVRCLGLNYELGIDTDGNIAPCCVWENRKPELNNLGNALATDIEELWYSVKFRQARSSIFNEGCQNCFNPSVVDLPKLTGISFLVPGQKKNKENLILTSMGYKENVEKPNHVHMRFTSRCNLSCRHCDIWKIEKDTKREISVEDWKRCIDKLHMWLGGFKLDLAGGEVLLYRDSIPLIQHCASKGITVNLTTNATLIDDTMAEKIASSGLYCINLSLDGLEDAHCYTRNNSNAFLNVHQAAQNLLKYRKHDIPYISLTTVITKYNLKQLPEIVKLTKEWGINNISFQALDQNFGAKYDGGWFKDSEFWPTEFPEVEEAIDGLISMKKKGIRIDNSVEQLNAFKRYFKNPIEEINNQCFTGINNFIVNEFGEALLCWNMPPVGNLLGDNPEQIWHSKSASQMRKQIERCKRTCRMLNCNYV